MKELTAANLMQPAGAAAYEKRSENRSKIYAYENDPAELSPEFKKTFRKNKDAWDFFSSQARSYQKVMIHHIMAAKQEKTRISRLAATIEASTNQIRLR